MSIGKEVLLITLNVDEENNNIDLSKRSINDSEIAFFTDNYKKYLKLFTLWKYVYLKVNNIEVCEENILKVDVDALYDFMKKTFWTLLKKYSVDELINKIFETTQYYILNDIDDHENITQIVSEYMNKKFVKVLPSLTEEIVMYSYEETGTEDIKYVLDFENFFDNNDNMMDKYDINVKYITNSIYNLNIKLIDINNIHICDINNVKNKYLDEIIKRANIKKVIIQKK